jgi:hypothetical protein
MVPFLSCFSSEVFQGDTFVLFPCDQNISPGREARLGLLQALGWLSPSDPGPVPLSSQSVSQESLRASWTTLEMRENKERKASRHLQPAGVEGSCWSPTLLELLGLLSPPNPLCWVCHGVMRKGGHPPAQPDLGAPVWALLALSSLGREPWALDRRDRFMANQLPPHSRLFLQDSSSGPGPFSLLCYT